MLRETIQGHTTYWRYYRQGHSRRRVLLLCDSWSEVRLNGTAIIRDSCSQDLRSNSNQPSGKAKACHRSQPTPTTKLRQFYIKLLFITDFTVTDSIKNDNDPSDRHGCPWTSPRKCQYYTACWKLKRMQTSCLLNSSNTNVLYWNTNVLYWKKSHHQHQINLIKFTILHQFCIVDVDMFSTTSLVLFLKGFYNFT